MNQPLLSRLARSASRLTPVALAATLLAACAATPSPAALNTVRTEANPVDRSQRAITNFSPALRCMDDLMFRSGTRDVTLMMEELKDATQKVPVSARDMMTSAVSDMTRRSRAVRLSVFGTDQQNVLQLLQQAQKTSAFAVVPEFNLRGTISQLDEEVKRNSSSFGLLTERVFGVRFGNEVKFSVLGFDSAISRTDTLTLVPGVSSKNTTVLVREDASASDGQARIVKSNAVFSFATARADGTSQAARNMVELAAIELVGKLIRAPYWQCLGTPDSDPEVQRELEDWFESMDDGERVVFVKERLRERRYFDGALDSAPDAHFAAALASYRQALGLAPGGPLDLAFFGRFITRAVPLGPLAAPRSRAAAAPAAAASTVAVVEAAAPPADAAPQPPAVAPMRAFLVPGKPGSVELRAAADVAGYAYCYARDPQKNAIRRIFPNRFAKDPRIEAGRAVALPGGQAFKLDPTHEFACLHAPREIYNSLPPPLRWGDFEDIRLTSFEAIRQQFALASGLPVALVQPQRIP
jgi:hypothetical protein